MRNTSAKMPSNHPKGKTEKIKNEYKSFSDEAIIPGLRECSTAHHILIQIIWVVLVVLGVLLTGYFIYEVAIEYIKEPVATKISRIHQQKYQVPPIAICLSDWLNEDVLLETDLTETGIRYLESLVNENNISGTEYIEGKRDFEQYALKNNFTFYAEVFTEASWDMSDEIFATCYGCTHIEKQFSEIFKKVCYKVVIPETKAGKLFKAKFGVTFQTTLGAANYLSVGNEIRATDKENSMEIIGGRKYEVKIDVEKETSLNRQDAPCFDEDYVTKNNYNEKVCFEVCVVEFFVSVGGLACKFLSYGEKIFNSTRKVDICPDSILRKENGMILEDEESISLNENASEVCREQCLEPCVSLTYTSTLVDKGSTYDDNTTELRFKFMYASKGIRTLEETLTYSFQSAVSNIGGQLGLWLGFSVISFFQIFLYFVNNCFKRAQQIEPSQNQ